MEFFVLYDKIFLQTFSVVFWRDILSTTHISIARKASRLERRLAGDREAHEKRIQSCGRGVTRARRTAWCVARGGRGLLENILNNCDFSCFLTEVYK